MVEPMPQFAKTGAGKSSCSNICLSPTQYITFYILILNDLSARITSKTNPIPGFVLFTGGISMIKRLIDFDSFLIDKLEQFCHWFQLWTGKTNLFLAKIANLLWIVGCIFDLVAAIRSSGGRLTANVFSGYFFLAFQLFIFFWFYNSEEYRVIRRLSNSLGNPHRIDPFWRLMRIFAVASFMIALSIGQKNEAFLAEHLGTKRILAF